MPYLFAQLNELEKEKTITIGVNKNHANIFFYQKTLIGKLLNWIVYISPVLIVILFIKFGFFAGIAAIILIGIHVSVTREMATDFTRAELLKDEDLFSAAYQANSINILINHTGEILRYPEDWTDFTNHL